MPRQLGSSDSALAGEDRSRKPGSLRPAVIGVAIVLPLALPVSLEDLARRLLDRQLVAAWFRRQLRSGFADVGSGARRDRSVPFLVRHKG